MNIYKKDGLKIAEVEYGWGMDMQAIEFPVEWAEDGIKKCLKVFDKENINMASVEMAHDCCLDVIINSRKGEDTYILAPFWNDLIEELKIIDSKLK